MAQSLFGVLDHLVYATPDTHATVDRLEMEIGVRATAGGRHPAWGTMNALISLGSRVYLEIIGPDPDQPSPSEGRLFELDSLARPCLITWVARAENLQATVAAAKAEGIDLGGVEERSRQRPDGSQLHWKMTDPRKGRGHSTLPHQLGQNCPPCRDRGERLHFEGTEGHAPRSGTVEKCPVALRVGFNGGAGSRSEACGHD
jgi:Glyoxalase-like domain